MIKKLLFISLILLSGCIYQDPCKYALYQCGMFSDNQAKIECIKLVLDKPACQCNNDVIEDYIVRELQN